MTEAPGVNDVPSAAEVQQLIRQAEKDDKKVLPALRTLLGTYPALLGFYTNVVESARDALVKQIGGEKNLAVQEFYARKLAAMGQELAGPEPSPVERLLVERIVMCWLHLYYAEAVYIQNMPELTLKQSEFYQKRITLAHNRYPVGNSDPGVSAASWGACRTGQYRRAASECRVIERPFNE